MSKIIAPKPSIDTLALDAKISIKAGKEIETASSAYGKVQTAMRQIRDAAISSNLELKGLKTTLENMSKAGVQGAQSNLDYFTRLDEAGKNRLSMPWSRARKELDATPAGDPEGEGAGEGEGEGDEGEPAADPKLGVTEVLAKAARKGLKVGMDLEEFLRAAAAAFADSAAANN